MNLFCTSSSTFLGPPDLYNPLTTFLSMFSYKVGEAFLHMPQSRALKRLERDQMSIDGKVATLALQADECEVQMKGLKVVLYAKFGRAINLDE